jgi:flagellar biosynthesis protein FlhG
VVFRAIYATVGPRSRAFGVLEELRRDREGGLQRTPVPRILETIAREDPVEHAPLVHALQRLKPWLVLNMITDPAEAEKGDKLRASARSYLGIDISHLGVIFRDELQSVALGSRIPILRYKPGCVLSKGLHRIIEKLPSVSAESLDSTPWLQGTKAVEELGSEAEAEEDFRGMRRDLEELLNSGALSTADLVESVRTQQIELSSLRRENARLQAMLGPGVESSRS